MRYVNARVRAAGKNPRVIRMAINTSIVPNKNGSLDIRGRDDRAIHSGTGNEEQRDNDGPRAQ